MCDVVTLIRSQWGLRTYVHINLCCTLFIAQLIFILAVDKTSSKVSDEIKHDLVIEFWYCIQTLCATVAILLHYFFLTSFMWMLMEGVVLYIVLVKVFTQINWKYYASFTLLSYGKTAYTAIISNCFTVFGKQSTKLYFIMIKEYMFGLC